MAEKYLILENGSRKFVFSVDIYLSYCIASHPKTRVPLSKIVLARVHIYTHTHTHKLQQ
jgi:hypothetical protein